MSTWRDTTLGDLESESNGTIQTGPFGSQLHASDYSNEGIPVVMPTNINDLRVDPTGIVRVGDDHVDRLSRHKLRPGDIVYSRRGDVEKCALITDREAGWLCGTGCLLVRVAGPTVDARFLAYALSTSATRTWISQHAVGATMANLNTSILREVPVSLPGVETQRAIAATLGALDRKVESNQRAITVAEALGDALIARVPRSPKRLVDIATLTMGSSPPGSSFSEESEGLPFYQGVRDFGTRFPRRRVWTNKPVRTAEPDDTLVSVRAPVGQLNRASELCCIGRGVASVRSLWPSTVYYALRSASDLWKPFQQEGTVFGSINRADLASAELLWPVTTEADAIEDQLSSLDRLVASLVREIHALIVLRDTLLSKLFASRTCVTDDAIAL
ncbi:hypothetical protein GQ649_14185 [Rhodococcus sp. DSM 6344]|nr:hypothetical protein [Rhodococcus erythropolis]